MLAFHIPESKVDPAFKYVPGTDLLVKAEVDTGDPEVGKLPPLLGLGFGKNPNPRSKLKVWAEKAADNCLARLSGCFATVVASRKVERNLLNRIQVATSMIWACCYDIGLIYCFVPSTKFNEISIRIRKLVKIAGLDQLTPKDVVYKLSTCLSPELMAAKQIIQLGLKMSNIDEIGNNRFLIKAQVGDERKPFWSVFTQQFNQLPQVTRKFIHENVDHLDKAKVQKIKNHLKCVFIQKENNRKALNKREKMKLAKKYQYSRAKVAARISQAETIAEKRKYSTPTGQRSRTRSLSNMRALVLKNVHAPFRSRYPENRQFDDRCPPDKMIKSCYLSRRHKEATIAQKHKLTLSTPTRSKRKKLDSEIIDE